jgi:hypothetical protein
MNFDQIHHAKRRLRPGEHRFYTFLLLPIVLILSLANFTRLTVKFSLPAERTEGAYDEFTARNLANLHTAGGHKPLPQHVDMIGMTEENRISSIGSSAEGTTPSSRLIVEISKHDEIQVSETKPEVPSSTTGTFETILTTEKDSIDAVHRTPPPIITEPSINDETKRSETTTIAKASPANKKGTIIDFISIGSLTKPEYQDAQERTFGSHMTVRNFFRITELNDTDATCYSNLTMAQLNSVVDYCKVLDGQSVVSKTLRERLKPFPNHKRNTGWMCAQKRPVDGLRLALQRYESEPLPSYLIIVDDDSYIHMNSILETLRASHPEEESHLVGGCVFNYPKTLHFTFPYGGHGSILTRKAIENLIRPIYCGASNPDGFTRHACWRLGHNLVGERQFFWQGMSVADLIFTYSARLPFTGVDEWKNGTGFCFHSDQALGYFLGFYHIAVPDDQFIGNPNDNLRKRFGFSNMAGGRAECNNEKKRCSTQNRICHYIEPQKMDRLFAAQQ